MRCAKQRQIPMVLQKGKDGGTLKRAGVVVVDLDNFRPVIVKPHISTRTEKAILRKISKGHQYLLRTERAQTGFKKGFSTQTNITKMLQLAHLGRGKHKRKKAIVFLDFRKAYDSVIQNKVFKILDSRCRDDKVRHLVRLIKSLHSNNELMIGSDKVRTNRGIAQGSVIALLLLNLYI